MKVCGLGWLLKTSLMSALNSLKKFFLAVTHCKTMLKMNAGF
jgi:hypothetical protein